MTEQSSQIDAKTGESVDGICGEQEFIAILLERVQPLLRLRELIDGLGPFRISRPIAASLIEQASELEDFLDDYDARYNRTFSTLVELVASLRGFSNILHGLQLLRSRFTTTGDEAADVRYRVETEASLEFAERSVRSLLDAFNHELTTFHPDALVVDPQSTVVAPDEGPTRRLPHNVGAEELAEAERHIANMASLFIAANKTLESQSTRRLWEDVGEMRKYVLEVCDEQQCRHLETRLHNLQSRYDTFIKNTVTEVNDPRLARFRYHISHAVHLLQVMTHLVHFYERHEDDIRTQRAHNKVSKLIDKRDVLDRLLNYGLYALHDVMESGVPVAEELLGAYTTNESVTLPIPSGCVLHARPASLISKIVAHHGVPVEMTLGSESCYAGSIMQVILLAAKNAELREVTFTGDETPIEHLRLLFDHGLAEAGIDTLPAELDYLKR